MSKMLPGSMALWLVLTLVPVSLSCSRSARRTAGILTLTSGVALGLGGIVLANYHCEDPDELNVPVDGARCFEGKPELGYSLSGLGLVTTVVGIYLLSTLPPEGEGEPIEEWPEEVRLPGEQLMMDEVPDVKKDEEDEGKEEDEGDGKNRDGG